MGTRTDRQDVAKLISRFFSALFADTRYKGLVRQGVSEISFLGSQVQPQVIYLTNRKVKGNHIVHASYFIVLYCILLYCACCSVRTFNPRPERTQNRNISCVTSVMM